MKLADTGNSATMSEDTIEREDVNKSLCKVVYADKSRTNLLGLIVGDVIERSLKDSAGIERCKNLRGDIELEAGKMRTSLSFRGGDIVVDEKSETKPRARVSGDLESLTQVALGQKLFAPYFRGKLKISGNIFFILKILPLLRDSKKKKNEQN
jgi:hypothetical protein